MSIVLSPYSIYSSITNNGLILHLDASNPLSYSGSGNTWFNLASNSSHGTLVNGVAYENINGGTFVFDGVNGSVNGSIEGSIFRGDFTQSAWIYRTGTGIWHGIFTNSNPATNYTYVMTFSDRTTTTPYNFLGINVLGVSPSGVFLDVGSHLNKWLFITITKSQNLLNIYCYKDGSLLQNSGILSWNNGNFATTNNYMVGRHWAGTDVQPFRGNIAHISLYNRSLAPQEINYNFNVTRKRFGV